MLSPSLFIQESQCKCWYCCSQLSEMKSVSQVSSLQGSKCICHCLCLCLCICLCQFFLVMSCLIITLNKCLKGHKSLGLLYNRFFGCSPMEVHRYVGRELKIFEGLRDNDSKKPPARKFYPHRSFNNVRKWTNTINLNTTLLRSTCISELNITILQNYNLLAQEIVLLFTNEYLTNIWGF